MNIPEQHHLLLQQVMKKKKILLVKGKKKIKRIFCSFSDISCLLLTFNRSQEVKHTRPLVLSLIQQSVCLSVCLCSAMHTATGINGMALCRQTQSSCKAPTPLFFLPSCILNSTLAPRSPNFPFNHTINHKPTVWHT